MQAKNLLKCLALILLAMMMTGQVANAQGDALRFFQSNPGNAGRLFFRSEPPIRVEPVRPVVRQREVRERPFVAPRRRLQPDQDTPVVVQPERAVVPVTTFVHVVGDSLSELLAQGLKEQLADSKPEIGIVKRSRSSSGIVRDDFYDWSKTLRELLAGSEKIDMVVMMLGSNDRQALRDETGSHDFRSDRWREIYAKRVDDLLTLAREKRVPFILVGMPVMQSQKLSADMLYINDVLRERASRGGASYVDIWEGFATEQSQYASAGPDVNGEIVKLRTADGVHFTKAGSRKLGFFVGKEVDLRLSQDRPGIELAALPSDLSEQVKRDSPGLTQQGLQASLPLPAELPTIPVILERPLAGPIVALTSAPLASGGQILKSKPLLASSEISIMVEQALGYGRLPPAKSGRADDFQWPRKQTLGPQTPAN